jgi:hypothetical protein
MALLDQQYNSPEIKVTSEKFIVTEEFINQATSISRSTDNLPPSPPILLKPAISKYGRNDT